MDEATSPAGEGNCRTRGLVHYANASTTFKKTLSRAAYGTRGDGDGANKYGAYLDVDTTNGYAQESSDVRFYQNTNFHWSAEDLSRRHWEVGYYENDF